MTHTLQIEEAEAREALLGARNMFSVSELYHENSRINESAPGVLLTASSLAVAPDGYKRYAHFETLLLPPPPPVAPQGPSLRAVLARRRSVRDYADAPLSISSLGLLLHAAVGSSDAGRHRAIPSAGGLYPLEVYVVVFEVDGARPGVYHYDVRRHGWTPFRTGDFRESFKRSIFIRDAADQAKAAVILTGVFGRSKIKYGERAYRFALLEAGHAMQNLCLVATDEQIGLCPIGGFIDDLANDLVEVDGVEEAVLYMAMLG